MKLERGGISMPTIVLEAQTEAGLGGGNTTQEAGLLNHSVETNPSAVRLEEYAETTPAPTGIRHSQYVIETLGRLGTRPENIGKTIELDRRWTGIGY